MFQSLDKAFRKSSNHWNLHQYVSACLLMLLCAASLPVTAQTLARFHTKAGTMDVMLYDSDKPITVDNFVNLVDANSYSNMFFHRSVSNFVIQGGGFTVADRNNTNWFNNPYAVANFGSILNEYSVGKEVHNTYGTIAMARVGGQTNSATSQFFFNLKDNSFLDNVDGGFTVFGHVVRGTNVLEYFRTKGLWNGIIDLAFFYGPAASTFDELPVDYAAVRPPYFPELYYVDIEIPRIEATLINTAQELQWNSVSGVLNRVQAGQPGSDIWTTLYETNADGSTLTITNTSMQPAETYRLSFGF